VITATAHLLQFLTIHLSNSHLYQIFTELLKKLDTEPRTILITKLLKKVPQQQLQPRLGDKPLVDLLNKTVEKLTTFLQRQDRTLKLSTLSAIMNLTALLSGVSAVQQQQQAQAPSLLEPAIQEITIVATLPFVSTQDYFLAQQTLELYRTLLVQTRAQKGELIGKIVERLIILCKSSIV
jgi:hypothetical protein